MRKYAAFFLSIFSFVWISAQKDSIYIQAKISSDHKYITVNQEISHYNLSEDTTDKIRLINWISGYKNRGSSLADRKLEDRNSDLYFAKKEELGSLSALNILLDGVATKETLDLSSENIVLKLAKPLTKGGTVKIQLNYTLKLPEAKFTGYGTSQNKILLKYFFLVPDSFPGNGARNFLDLEETANFNTYWTINMDVPANYFSAGNLPEIQPNYFKGYLKNDPEIIISDRNFPKITANVDGKNTVVTFGYQLSKEEREHLEFYLPLQLKFIKEHTGIQPTEIYISEKFKKKEDFFGNDDIKFWVLKFPLFTEGENIDLDYFSIISKNVLEQNLITEKRTNHWFKNGLKSYLELQYLKKYYKDHLLLGMLADAKILGIKPLKIFHAAKLKLTERYGIAYHYMMTQNLDQKISENFQDLSNFNEMAISNFETGSIFNFVAEKMGPEKFEGFLQDYLLKNGDGKINTDNFLDELAMKSQYSSAFISNLIQKKQRVNFKLKKFKRNGDKLLVTVKKNEPEPVPFKLETLSKTEASQSYWFDTPEKSSEETYVVPDANAEKLVINQGNYFPETSFRDNYLYTKGIFSNTKKIRLKIIRDIPNPEYNEIYVNPRLTFNAYDKILLGLNFRNQSLFDHKLSYSITPYYSTGTGKLTASGGVSYSFLPPESFFRNLSVGVSGSYFHYDYGLAYRKFSAGASMDFSKNPRSTVDKSIWASFNYFQKDLTEKMKLANEYDEYNLWSAGYAYSNSKMIHEHYFSGHIQGMEDFQKITAEGYYRFEYLQNRKISFRLFAGLFLNNKTRNNIFDYGISKVSNYSFSYGLLGQSATSGLLSQQFILADGGFKSYIDKTANHWITALNVDSHVWKMFNIYADAGVYKNKGLSQKFIWDSGVKVRIIPDFLEVYLPVYSSLGFEPAFKDYASRIRFTLVLNLNAIVNTVRRGWY